MSIKTADLPRPLIANAMLSWTTQIADPWTNSPHPGVRYSYGGWRADIVTANGIIGWDCSGCLGWVLAWQLGMRNLPGLPASWYKTLLYHPSPALAYSSWDALYTVTDGPAVPGDILCWPTHVGVAVTANLMASALSTEYGTFVSPFTGDWAPGGTAPIVRRMLWSEYIKLDDLSEA